MTRDKALALLKAHEAEFKKLGMTHLFLFGSTACDDARNDSDVDLFFDHPKGAIGLFELMELQERASEILEAKTDLMTRDSLHPLLKGRIEASAVQVF